MGTKENRVRTLKRGKFMRPLRFLWLLHWRQPDVQLALLVDLERQFSKKTCVLGCAL